jgi:hypothetical protein
MQDQLKWPETKSAQSPSKNLSPPVEAGAATQHSENGLQARPLMKCEREKPVFIVGCPRSGTTLLYHSILSSGDFAIYPREFGTFNFLAARFPDLTSTAARKRLLEFFIQSENFTVTGLERSDVEPRVLSECRNTGDFLRIVMEEMCRKQGARRWAEKTPSHLLYIAEIKRVMPDALIVHIIRDGRDAALSMANFSGLRSCFWEFGGRLLAMGAEWKWSVQKGRAAGKKIGRDYYELHYEDLVQKPRETLSKLGEFIGHDLDYDRILRAGVGSVRNPETSFPPDASGPVGRWTTRYAPRELARFEALIGDCLENLGYPLATTLRQRRNAFLAKACGVLDVAQLELKHWIRLNTLLGRWTGWRRIRRVNDHAI